MSELRECRGIPGGVFRGVNIMTPTVVGYYVGTYQGRVAYVEASVGSGLTEGTEIGGLTVRRADGERFDPDPSYGGFPAGELARRAREILKDPPLQAEPEG